MNVSAVMFKAHCSVLLAPLVLNGYRADATGVIKALLTGEHAALAGVAAHFMQ